MPAEMAPQALDMTPKANAPLWRSHLETRATCVFTMSSRATAWANANGLQEQKERSDRTDTRRVSYPTQLPESPFLIRARGPKWIEFLAKQYNKTTVRVTNFATPNSTVDKFFWAPRPMGKGPGTGRNSFKDEITVFQGSYSALDLKPYNEWNPATTLFVAWFGLNEAMQSVIRDRRIPMDAVFAAYRASLERVRTTEIFLRPMSN